MLGRKFLLAVMFFLGMSQLKGAALPLPAAGDIRLEIDWNLRFEQLNERTGDVVSKALNRFFSNYMICAKMTYRLTFMYRHNNLFKSSESEGRAVQYVDKKSFFGILTDYPILWERVFMDEAFIDAALFALKIYLCKRIQALALEPNSDGLKQYLEDFNGNLYNARMMEIMGTPESIEIEANDMKRFSNVMHEVFENERVKFEVTRIFGLALIEFGQNVNMSSEQPQEVKQYEVCSLQ